MCSRSGFRTTEAEASVQPGNYKSFSHSEVSNKDDKAWTMCGKFAFFLMEFMSFLKSVEMNCAHYARDPSGVQRINNDVMRLTLAIQPGGTYNII